MLYGTVYPFPPHFAQSGSAAWPRFKTTQSQSSASSGRDVDGDAVRAGVGEVGGGEGRGIGGGCTTARGTIGVPDDMLLSMSRIFWASTALLISPRCEAIAASRQSSGARQFGRCGDAGGAVGCPS